MTLKSRSDRYGAVAVSIHWLSAIMILALLASGFRAANAIDAETKVGFLRVHIPIAILILLLTIFRIVWWWHYDGKPLPVQGSPGWQERVARWVHIAFYLVVLGMVASGIGMLVLSGAAPAIFGMSGSALPNFHDYPPRVPHGLGAFLLVVLVALHAGAALYHHFVRRDGLLRRMWYG
jgi:cytochrome b561